MRAIRAQEHLTINILSSNRTTQPFGLDGGQPGKPGRNYIRRVDGSCVELNACAEDHLAPGDTIIIETPGGGAYGKKKDGL